MNISWKVFSSLQMSGMFSVYPPYSTGCFLCFCPTGMSIWSIPGDTPGNRDESNSVLSKGSHQPDFKQEEGQYMHRALHWAEERKNPQGQHLKDVAWQGKGAERWLVRGAEGKYSVRPNSWSPRKEDSLLRWVKLEDDGKNPQGFVHSTKWELC